MHQTDTCKRAARLESISGTLAATGLELHLEMFYIVVRALGEPSPLALRVGKRSEDLVGRLRETVFDGKGVMLDELLCHEISPCKSEVYTSVYKLRNSKSSMFGAAPAEAQAQREITSA